MITATELWNRTVLSALVRFRFSGKISLGYLPFRGYRRSTLLFPFRPDELLWTCLAGRLGRESSRVETLLSLTCAGRSRTFWLCGLRIQVSFVVLAPDAVLTTYLYRSQLTSLNQTMDGPSVALQQRSHLDRKHQPLAGD